MRAVTARSAVPDSNPTDTAQRDSPSRTHRHPPSGHHQIAARAARTTTGATSANNHGVGALTIVIRDASSGRAMAGRTSRAVPMRTAVVGARGSTVVTGES